MSRLRSALVPDTLGRVPQDLRHQREVGQERTKPLHDATRAAEEIEEPMPRRTTTAELRDRIDGLGIAMFAIIGALVDSVAEIHPDSDDLWERLPAKAVGLVLTLEGVEQDTISLEAIDSAFAAIAAAFAGRREARGVEPEGDNDNERG